MSLAQRELHEIELDGQALPVRVRRSARAARLSLRVGLKGDELVLVLPPGVKLEHGLRFCRQQQDWIRRRLSSLSPQVPFAPGASLPLLGQDHVLRHAPEARRGVWAEGGEIFVSGGIEHFPRRVGDWLRRQARTEIVARAYPMAAEIGKRIASLSLRDTTSRWGSCTARGDLAFSWRLVLAPEKVLTYVVAHEVAHLAEMNHSPRFWSVVDTLCPHAVESRAWLKRHGTSLHRFG
ncbi:M48 family metallopeptidase [Telmatospirillum sp. J64-1]|uniref:M48 family metallopeptidase n=1 Tax=Telmatospirillum sp. J64-1 TaxID=2502183 RepID=UPI00115E5784|nr:SprT family zinc-dependent metalloprotease [Telmatospirillum sp. J64-1]